jgi:16S rRNA (cytidine1402-2'-O)-methyltransferase
MRRNGREAAGDDMRAKAREGEGEAGDAKGLAPAPEAEPGSLYVVATPIGNLRDLTLRARDVLASVDVIAAEDTRVTATLLARFGIPTRATALHAHNEARRCADVVAWLSQGRSVALVTDAGTPGISDPGSRVVRAARDAGFRVVPVPGASSVAAAVSAAGLAAERFVFVGFLPSSAKARRELIARLAPLPFAIVLYEAPHRVRDTIAELACALSGRDVVVAREITKAFETIARVPLAQAQAWLAADANRERGEFVLIVDAPPAQQEAPPMDEGVERWLAALAAELPPARAAKVAAAATGIAREALYERLRQIARAGQ